MFLTLLLLLCVCVRVLFNASGDKPIFLLILYIFSPTDTHKQVYDQLIAPIFELQKYCYMFRLPSVSVLREQQYSNTYTALLCDLSTANGKI